MDAGMVGAIAGSTIGVLGGLIGTGCSIWRAESSAERQFIVKASVVMWSLIPAFLAGILLIPNPYNHLMWLPYCFMLSFGIRKFSEKLQQIRESNSPDHA